MLNSVALSVAISVAFHSTEDFHYHRSRKPKTLFIVISFFIDIDIAILIDIAIDIEIDIDIAIFTAILFPSCHPLLHRGLG